MRYFGEYVVEVKQVLKHGTLESKGEQLCIYDFDTELVLYWTNTHTSILHVEIEEDSIYYLAENVGPGGQSTKSLFKLYEQENNMKI